MRVARMLEAAMAAGVLAVAGCSVKPAADANPATAGSLVGAWRSTIHFSGGVLAPFTDLEFLYAFNAGGTMTESSNYDEAQPVTPAYGIWRQSAPGQFEAVYVFYNTKPPKRLDELPKGGGWLPSGRGVLTERITLAADGARYESTIAMQLFDQAGNRVDGGGSATGHGERIHF